MPTSVTKNLDIYDVRDWADEGVNQTAQIQAAIDAAGVRGTRLFFPQGEWIADQLEMTGRSQLFGVGDRSRLVQDPGASGTFLTVDGRDGPYVLPNGAFTERRTILDHLHLQGNGVVDAANVGLAARGLYACRIADVSIENFGGPCMVNTDWVLLSEFERILLNRPVGADVTGVPYWLATGVFNGNLCDRMGFRSLTTDLDGPAVVKFDADTNSGPPLDGTFVPEHNNFTGWWTEFQHTPADGVIFDMRLNRTNFEIPLWWDNFGAGGGDCCFMRLRWDGDGAGVRDGAGNFLWGQVPGDNNGYDAGIIVEQPRNRIEGTRLFQNNNVRLEPAAGLCHVSLGGQQSGIATGGAPGSGQPGIIDNSGLDTNTLIDTTGQGAMFRLAAHVPFQMWDTGGTLRTLQQPAGPGPASWV